MRMFKFFTELIMIKKTVIRIAAVAMCTWFLVASCRYNASTAENGTSLKPNSTEQPTPVNANALAQAEAARKAAIEAGVDQVAPDELADTDSQLNALSARSNNGENVNLELADVSARYNALEQYAKAIAAKNRIDELDFVQYSQTDYDAGNNVLTALASLFDDSSATGAQLLAQAATANASYARVLFAGFKVKAREECTAAFVAKRNADNVYAGVVEKTRYNEAVEFYRNGDKTYALQEPEQAFNNYSNARNIFQTLYEEISEKRRQALANGNE